VYNHFSTREEVIKALALWLGDTLCQRITDSQQGIAGGAERMSIGIRRYLWLAEQSPPWALLMMQVAMAAPQLVDEITVYARADLRLGLRQKAFRVPNEDAAIDMISGTVLNAMQSIVRGNAAAGYGQTIAAMVLRGLGMDFEAATEVARRPLPDFPPLGAVPSRLAPRAGKAGARIAAPASVATKVATKVAAKTAPKSVPKSAPKGGAKAARKA
jgi:AcrR family transcriptional regulator